LAQRRRTGTVENKVNTGNDISGVSFSPEERLILYCLQRDSAAVANRTNDLGSRDPVGMAGLALDLIDWNRVTLSAGSHGVLPLVYCRLKSVDRIALAALAPMRAQFYGHALNNLHVARELVRVSGLLKAKGIAAIAFKGPVLALQAWGDVALRQFNDLDLLVRPTDAARAAEILIAAGYWPRMFDRQHPEVSIARRCEDEFIRPGSPWVIDLHWELHPAYFDYGPGAAAVWDRAISVKVEGAEVLTLAPDDLVLFLAVHAAKHGWINLGWICDFDAALRARRDSDLPALAEAASGSRCLRMLLLGIALAADLLAAPIPRLFADAIRRDSTIASLVTGIERRLFASVGMQARLYSEWTVPIRTISRSSGRLRFLVSRAFTPNIDDFDFISLPPMLHPLYYATRPLRLAWQQSRRLFIDVPHPLKRLRGEPR
jgi:hypothetical protein